MNVLIVGSGGREHALVWRFSELPYVTKIYVAPGNAGTAQIAENVPINTVDVASLVEFARKNDINLTIVGPEDALAAGIVDAFKEAQLPIFGPTKEMARIESSKAYAKSLINKLHIPTASHKKFDDYARAITYLKTQSFPIVIKADGLAQGKGVAVCDSLPNALKTLEEFMIKRTMGDAGSTVIIEEYLQGVEVDVYVLSDGSDFHMLWPTQGTKPLYDDDKGPNTGSMGMVLPAPTITEEDVAAIADQLVRPLLSYLRDQGTPFVGLFHPGVMVTKSGPKILEYNVRPGDPDTQLYARLIQGDLLKLYQACVEGRLSEHSPTLSDQHAISVSVVSQGYPGNYQKGLPILGLEDAAKIPGVQIFHGGTKRVDDQLVTNGGRVVHVTAVGDTLQQAEERAYQAVQLISFEGKHARRDIGKPFLRDYRHTRNLEFKTL